MNIQEPKIWLEGWPNVTSRTNPKRLKNLCQYFLFVRLSGCYLFLFHISLAHFNFQVKFHSKWVHVPEMTEEK